MVLHCRIPCLWCCSFCLAQLPEPVCKPHVDVASCPGESCLTMLSEPCSSATAVFNLRQPCLLVRADKPGTTVPQVLHDWQRGKIPFFAMPPEHSDRPAAAEGAAAAQAIADSAPADQQVIQHRPGEHIL